MAKMYVHEEMVGLLGHYKILLHIHQRRERTLARIFCVLCLIHSLLKVECEHLKMTSYAATSGSPTELFVNTWWKNYVRE